MSTFRAYKDFENRLIYSLGRRLSELGNFIVRILRTGMVLGRQRITVLVVPESDRKPTSFGISIFAIAFAVLLLAGMTAGIVVSRQQGTTLYQMLTRSNHDLTSGRASLQSMQDRISELQRVYAVFQRTMDRTMGTLHLSTASGDGPSNDIQSFSQQVSLDGSSTDVAQLQSIVQSMQSSSAGLREIAHVYANRMHALATLPSLWPVQGDLGVITTNFGPAIEPFTHQMYLHLGIDIAAAAGTPIVASGDGTVVEVAYQPLGYGNYVLIRHGFGFYTRYAHMMRVATHVGAQVNQGEIIGYMGDTGLSTGPHVHFEILLGDQVIDPMSFMSISDRYHPTTVSQD